MTEVLVFSQYSTSRLHYVLHWVLTNRLGLDYRITNNVMEFGASQEAKINYSNQTLMGCINIDSSSILYETTINENFGEIGEWNGKHIIFKNGGNEIPFDLFGAVFYCLSRMEEYGNSKLDKHGRFTHQSSILHKLKVLHTPIVDLWLEGFKEVLLSFYPALEVKSAKFKFLNTFDIDQAFCYAEKGFTRIAGGFMKDLMKFKFRQTLERVLVILGVRADPFDTFEYIIEKHHQYNLKTVVFLLLADFGAYDKNIKITNLKFIQRMKRLLQEVSLGIHPSYFSFQDLELMRKEVDRLAALQGQAVLQSRQHYLKYELPHTFRNLIELGIRQEYSMGYAEVVGFRAGTAHSFHWFDIERNEVTLLEIHPSCVMDVTLKNYLQLTPEQAKATLLNLIQEVKQVNGTFIPIWHNESISGFGPWKGWRAVYEAMLDFTK
ncbi:MAG: polysaccharide deacetylase family protein [Bacteroidetes bacterium]|nr:polysaccharide deacetylase family protein [Bacteroidota bacterium]